MDRAFWIEYMRRLRVAAKAKDDAAWAWGYLGPGSPEYQDEVARRERALKVAREMVGARYG